MYYLFNLLLVTFTKFLEKFCFSTRKGWFPIVNAARMVVEEEQNDEEQNNKLDQGQESRSKKKAKEKIGFRDRKVNIQILFMSL